MLKDEYLIGVAIIHDGVIYWDEKPARHDKTINQVLGAGFHPLACQHQGFHTNHRRFVSREEAANIARKAGQLLRPDNDTDFLCSEDVW